MSQSNPNNEPTMDEILASIRKIISEDQPKTAEAEAFQALEPELPPEPTSEEPLPANVSEPIGEVPVSEVEGEPARVDSFSEVDYAADDLAAEVYAEEVSIEGEFISDLTRDALDQAFEKIQADPESAPISTAEDGSVEDVFFRAVQTAFDPTLQTWVDSHGEEIVSRLAPLIREWMDENLPPLIEIAVMKEISRAVRSRRR